MKERYQPGLKEYIPKRGLLDQEDYPDNFYYLESQKCARKFMLYIFDKTLKRTKQQLLPSEDKNSRTQIYQEIEDHLEDYTNEKYFSGFYKEGKELLLELRNMSTKKGIKRLDKCNNEELGKILGAELFLKTAMVNTKESKYRCANTTVSLLGIDIESEEFHFTSNNTEKYFDECALIKQKLFHNKVFPAPKNNNTCKAVCGKKGCAEKNYYDKILDDKLMKSARTIMVMNYDEIAYGGCSNCDLLNKKKHLPAYMVAAQPNRVYINPRSVFYDNFVNTMERATKKFKSIKS